MGSLLVGRASIRPSCGRSASLAGTEKMRRSVRPKLTAILVTGLLSSSAFAALVSSSASFVVRGDTRIGSFAVKKDGTLSGAIGAFGEPAHLRRRYESCVATWPGYGLTMDVYNLGGQDPCTPEYGFFSRAVLHGRRWRTASGLRIGMPSRMVLRLHPHATWHRGERGFWPSGWWLVTRGSPYGDHSGYPGILAETRNGRVFAFHVRYPAGGD